jgi:programmed cell death 8 (apoptosis-inducing factor)
LNDLFLLFSLFFEQDEFYCNPVELSGKENGGVAVVRGHRVVKLDIVGRKAELDDGRTITYDKCLIATGKYFPFIIYS